MRGASAGMEGSARERANVIQPNSTTEISLADLLFPPSPPASSSVIPPLPSSQSSPTIIENSGDDLPSPILRRTLPFRPPRPKGASQSTRARVVPETTLDSSEEDEEERQRIKSLKSQRRKGKGRPSQTIYILDDSEDERINSALANPSTSKPIPRPRRRITISIDLDPDPSSSSDRESDTAPPPLPSRSLRLPCQPIPSLKLRTKSKPINRTEAECICVGDSEDEGEGAQRKVESFQGETVVSLPTESTVGGTPQPIDYPDPFATEYDPYAGILTYEPSHRNPVRFRKNLLDCLDVETTPIRNQNSVKKVPNRIEIDLTLSSGDESAFIPLSKTHTPKSVKPPPPHAKRLLSTPAKSTPAKAARNSTPTQKRIGKSDSLTLERRNTLAIDWIRRLDKAVFRKRWNGLRCLDGEAEENGEGLPSDIAINWNNKLRTTAGTASWKKSTSPNGQKINLISIDLSIKVLDTVEKLRSTLAHELVHVAAWILSGETKPAHGKAFQLWGQRISQKFPEITVTTKHSYEIAYKFRWRCLDVARCGKIFSRHSNSIDVERQGCQCGSRIARIDADGNVKLPPKRTLWDEFRSVTSVQIRKDNPLVAQTEIFKMVAAKWTEEKQRVEQMERAMGKLEI